MSRLLPGKISICLLGIFMVCGLNTFAQINVDKPIDILAALNDSTAFAVTDPQLSFGTIEKFFDRNPYTDAGVNQESSLTVTLEFDSLVEVSKSKVFFWTSGQWTLESADNLSDLNNHTGSYRLLADSRSYSPFQWDSVTTDQYTAAVFRLTATDTQNSTVYLGEWTLSRDITITSFYLTPYPAKVLPGTTLKLKANLIDENNNIVDYNLNEPLVWSSSNTSVANIDGNGYLTGVSLGNATVTVSTESHSLSGTEPVHVLNDFQSPKAPTKIVKVALIIQDPIIPQFGNKRIHEKWGWTDPNLMVAQLQQEFKNASDSTVIFQIAEFYEDQNIFTMIDSTYMTIDTIAYYFQNSYTLYTELKYLAETQGRVHYDYNGMIDFYDLDTKRNNGDIDEVWVYAFPFGGMYESILAGPGAIWWNAPPLPHPGLEKTLSIMGWNYERGVAEAMHSMGHRFESAISHAYGRWNNQSSDPNNWEIFTRINKDNPGKANIGNIHYPPNGISDYDYTNTSYVITYADNWKRYPYLLNQTRSVNCSEWSCGQLGYMRWWFNHLPRYEGITDSILNDWWYYALDYYAAVDLAHETPIVGVKDNLMNYIPSDYKLYQNFPNPFNPDTDIRFRIPVQSKVKLKIYDILGRLVTQLVDEEKRPGTYDIIWTGKNLHNQKVASGIYFYCLETDKFIQTKKLVLLK